MAPLRRLCLCLLLALLLPLPAAPAPAPVPVPLRHPDWTACRILSRELSRLLATVKEPHSALEGMQLLEEDPQNWPPRIRCSDACDPQTLETNHTRCLHRIRQALQHYRDLLGSDIFRDQPQPQLETTMEQLLRHVQVRNRGLAGRHQAPLGPPALTALSPQEGHGRPPRHPLVSTDVWAQPYQRHLALKRLRSFAAVMGRVFNHSAR
ncbi:PREDICTED: interleukin-23 subunit alpha [Sturnus vulgaris]|uniref:interleukin-23 subunit alpha n=1 Tax=Sturnus vulgaris TaxID=9172 RepID=UPI00071A1FA3|nr:PREDICTED: interleukin-23 subunit alpha [Sturnus vulgaris]